MTINHIEGAVDRAERLIRNGMRIEDAAIDAGHFFSCSSRLIQSAVKVRLQHAVPDDSEPACPGPNGHEWNYTGTAYGGDDPSYMGEGRVYCAHCGADGDA